VNTAKVGTCRSDHFMPGTKGAEMWGTHCGHTPGAGTGGRARGRDQGQRVSALGFGVAVHQSRETRTTEIRAINIALAHDFE
jgi:hypothetical protein